MTTHSFETPNVHTRTGAEDQPECHFVLLARSLPQTIQIYDYSQTAFVHTLLTVCLTTSQPLVLSTCRARQRTQLEAFSEEYLHEGHRCSGGDEAVRVPDLTRTFQERKRLLLPFLTVNHHNVNPSTRLHGPGLKILETLPRHHHLMNGTEFQPRDARKRRGTAVNRSLRRQTCNVVTHCLHAFPVSSVGASGERVSLLDRLKGEKSTRSHGLPTGRPTDWGSPWASAAVAASRKPCASPNAACAL